MKKAQKTQVLDSLATTLSQVKSLTVVNYQGLAMKDLQVLRSELAKVGGEFLVVKNSLLRLALEKAKGARESIEPTLFDGPTAVIFAKDDEIAPLQVLAKVIKERDLPKLKFGLFDNAIMDSASLTELSKLPGKSTLYAHLLGALSGPAYGLVGTLNANLQKLVYILDQRAKQIAQ